MTSQILLIGEHVVGHAVGIQGDAIITSALGASPVTIPTMLSTSLHPLRRTTTGVDPLFFADALRQCLDHNNIKAIKLSALSDVSILHTIIEELKSKKDHVPVVLSPVLTTEMGEYLIDPVAIPIIKSQLIPLIDVLVISVLDAEIITGLDIDNAARACEAARVLKNMGAKHVILSGDAFQHDFINSMYVGEESEELLVEQQSRKDRKHGRNLCGSWVMATAITASLGQGFCVIESLSRARHYIEVALDQSFNQDDSYQSLNLSHTVHPFVHNKDKVNFQVISNIENVSG